MIGWREHGSKPGSGGANSEVASRINQRERLKELAMQTIDLSKDPYFMKNHLGTFECKLCLTLHPNEGNYLAHTQGKRHQDNLARRAARERKEGAGGITVASGTATKSKPSLRITPKIGQPQTHFSKHKDPQTGQLSVLFVVAYPEIADAVVPRYRFMSAFEQKIEQPDRNWQYILFAAEPYQTIAFKVPNKEIERSVADENGRSLFWTHWDKERKLFYLNITFKKFRDDFGSALAPSTDGDDMEM
eukprot:TRINITY_DN553_c0_g3_i1.p1 TRINITY_DN553_c0_g3~~TRINITY_DN553_c0_g3_i1.p1  ORF type:complete len:246 (-),score=29.06 TRINITY_DN553_c0_g3_i1:326-1063(-)